MYNLQDFDKNISPTILKKAEDYASRGLVHALEEVSPGTWSAEVEGSEEYNVEITLDARNTVREYTCDCPYDGDICKHVVATLLELRQEISSGTHRKGKNRPASPPCCNPSRNRSYGHTCSNMQQKTKSSGLYSKYILPTRMKAPTSKQNSRN